MGEHFLIKEYSWTDLQILVEYMKHRKWEETRASENCKKDSLKREKVHGQNLESSKL